jgi:hypothetical protein
MKNHQHPVPVLVTEYILLHGRYWVFRDLYRSVMLQLENFWAFCEEGKPYLAKQLCGAYFWASLSPRERQLAGMCISQLNAFGDLPLVRVACRPNRYLVPAEAINASLAMMLLQSESSVSSGAVSTSVKGVSR